MIKPIIMPIKRIPNSLSDNPHVLLRPLAGICHVRWYGYITIANYFAICPETALCGEIEILILIFSLRVPSSYSSASYIAMIIYFIGDVLHIVKYGSYLLTYNALAKRMRNCFFGDVLLNEKSNDLQELFEANS